MHGLSTQHSSVCMTVCVLASLDLRALKAHCLLAVLYHGISNSFSSPHVAGKPHACCDKHLRTENVGFGGKIVLNLSDRLGLKFKSS